MTKINRFPNVHRLTLSPWHRLAGAALHRAARDAGDMHNPRRAAESRFWLRYGVGAPLAELCGIDTALLAYVEELPALPGQNGGPPAVELARLMAGITSW